MAAVGIYNLKRAVLPDLLVTRGPEIGRAPTKRRLKTLRQSHDVTAAAWHLAQCWHPAAPRSEVAELGPSSDNKKRGPRPAFLF